MLAYDIFERLQKKSPTILSVGNRTAGETILTTMRSIGVKGFLSFESSEAADIASWVDGMMIDIIGIGDGRIDASIAAAKIANQRKIPVVVDISRASASMYRVATFFKLMNEVHVSMVCGHIEDYEALVQRHESLNRLKRKKDYYNLRQSLQEIARELQTTIVLCDEQCIITDGDYTSTLVNYDPILERVLGTENILFTMITSFLTIEGYDPITKALMACGTMNVAAELVGKKYPDVGPGYGKLHLYDEIYRMTSRDLVKYMDFTEE